MKNFKYNLLIGTILLFLVSCINNSVEPPKYRQTLLLNNLEKAQKINTIVNELKSKDSSKSILQSKLDSCYVEWRGSAITQLESDSHYLNDDFLHVNDSLTDQAFALSRWKETVSPEVYQEYIEPYKLDYEYVDNWRSVLYKEYLDTLQSKPAIKKLDSLYKFHMDNTYYSLSSTVELENLVVAKNNYSWLHIAQEGDCYKRCRYVIYHLRAAGAPASFDYIPSWGNRPYSKHAYVGLPNREQQLPFYLENTNDTTKLVNDLNAAMALKNTYFFKESEVPDELSVQYEKTIPKVYRQTWTPNEEIVELIDNTPRPEIIPKLINPNFEDVTDQYLTGADVIVEAGSEASANIAYLTTFGINGWIPVAYSPYEIWGKAIFKNVGKNILYLPIVRYYNGEREYGSPFVLNNKGRKNILACNGQKMNMRLVRKFPLFSYTASHVLSLKNATIEASNDPDFKTYTELYKQQEYPFYTQQIKIHNNEKFRYLRVRNHGERVRLAEFECFIDSLSFTKKKVDIRYKNKTLEGKWNNIYDEDYNTYLVSRDIRIDLGKRYSIHQVNLTPRNDTNNIIPGNLYELFYWDGGWKSAGKKKAEKYNLLYRNVPAGTLYWLRCLTGGKEERIFTYKNGKQIWW